MMTNLDGRWRRLAPPLLAAAVLTGCDGSDGNGGGAAAAANPAPAAGPAPQLGAPDDTGDTAVGPVFVTDDGQTLYTFENDRDDADGDGAGDSDCNGACTDTWPPLLADDASQASGQFGIVTRDDGTSRQWTFKGLPLYEFAGDGAPGETNGDGIGDVWYVARPDPWARAEVDAEAKGEVFVGLGSVAGVDGTGGRADTRTDRDGLTLYTFENDRNDAQGDGAGDSDCNDGCAEVWPPLFADAGATEGGPFTIIDRDDGTRQWALNGLPVYFYAPDTAPGDTLGEGVGNVWYVARPGPVAVVDSAISSVFAGTTSIVDVDAAGGRGTERTDREGFTLYVFDNDRNDVDGDGPGDSDCNGNCAVTWPPLFADAGAAPTGKFSVIDRDDGSRQWAFDGEPLYFFINDLAAGDTNGDGVGGVWHAARPAPLQLFQSGPEGLIFAARGEIANVDANGERAASESDRTGFTVYRFDNDANDADGDGADDSDCNGGCAATWPPLYADDDDRAAGAFAIIDREDGSRQWTFNGLPLYFFTGDGAPGDVNGVYGTWFTVGLDNGTPPPDDPEPGYLDP